LCFLSVLCVLFEFINHGSHRGNTVQALARWRHPVAPSEALYVLYRVMRPASYYHIPMANEIASNLPVFFVVADSLLLGVTMIKPTTSFFFFFRRHNRICGLAVAIKNNFLGVFPRFQKNPKIKVSWESCAKPAKMPIM
jgi:hypothetical protein